MSTETRTESLTMGQRESSKLTKIQKFAAFLLIINAESAANVMKQLSEEELEAVYSEMTKFPTIGLNLQREILEEFSPVAVEAGTAINTGAEKVQGLLEKSVGSFRASNLLSRHSAGRPPAAALQHIMEMDVRHIFNQLRYEQPQTVALVLSYLAPDKAAQLISLLRPELRDPVIERLATMAPTSVEVVESVVEVLHHKFAHGQASALNQTGGIKATAQLLNALPKNISKSVVVSLEERNADLSKTIIQKMFNFEDLARLDKVSLQKILKEVDTRSFAVALKTASQRLTTALLSCISKRAGESIREEMSFLGAIKVREIEAAQSEIITIARRLEEAGEITLEEEKQALTA